MRPDEIAGLTGIDPSRLQRILRNLEKRGFVATVGEDLFITRDGRRSYRVKSANLIGASSTRPNVVKYSIAPVTSEL